ncbi:MAG: S41 family peptidase, partial [Fusobacteriaceae bacterium]
SPIEDTPAYKAGIKPKDKILSINDESTLPLTSDESAKKLKGSAGTKVKLKIYRESLKDTTEIELTREIINLKYVKSNILSNDIGYLRLTQFGENVYPDLAKELTSLQKKGMKGLVLDLRSNPGGALDQAVKIASMFIDKGKIVTTRGKNKDEQISMREGKYFGDYPLVVLINSGSASASEIVAGAVKDYKRGTLIGDKSFGKGSVQTLIPLPDGDGIKLTIAKYYTPNNISIHGIGIEPDIKVKEDEDYLLFDSVVTNVSEEATKENRVQIIKEIKGEDKAKEYEGKVDYQLDKAIEIISNKLGINYIAKIPPVKTEEKK